jgi:nucleotide-binding universal stress UspA family protein
MTNPQPILVGVDGSRASSAAIRFGVHEAHRLGAPLRLVHAIAEFIPVAPMHPLLPCDLEDTGRAILASAAEEARTLSQTIELTTSLVDGPRIPALVRTTHDARLMALGHDRHHSLDRLLTGATVTGVAASSACPVVAVPPEWTPRGEHHCVLVGITSANDSSPLLRRAFQYAAERKSRLLVLHAWELPGQYDDLVTARVDVEAWQERARHAIERATAPFEEAYPEVPLDVQVVHGQAAHALTRASQGADLVLLARRVHAFPLGHIGGTVRTLLRHSACPVAVVPPSVEPDRGPDMVLEERGALLK